MDGWGEGWVWSRGERREKGKWAGTARRTSPPAASLLKALLVPRNQERVARSGFSAAPPLVVLRVGHELPPELRAHVAHRSYEGIQRRVRSLMSRAHAQTRRKVFQLNARSVRDSDGRNAPDSTRSRRKSAITATQYGLGNFDVLLCPSGMAQDSRGPGN